MKIESQEWPAAMNVFLEQAHMRLWYRLPTPGSEKFKLNAVSGSHTAEEALQLLTAGTRLTATILGGRYIDIQVAAGPLETETAPGTAMAPVPEVLVESTRSFNIGLAPAAFGIEGRLVFSHEQLENSPYRDVGAFLRAMLTSNVITSVPNGAAMISGVTGQINLRGLGNGETVVQVDGHRLAGVFFGGVIQQPELDQMPLSSVERIEVLGGSASGHAGGGAVGGLINIVRRREAPGVRFAIQSEQLAGIRSGTSDLFFERTVGFDEGRGWASFSASWTQQGLVQAWQHNMTTEGRETVAGNNRQHAESGPPPLGAGKNIRGIGGSAGPPEGTDLLGNISRDSNGTERFTPVFIYSLADTAQEQGGAFATVRPRQEVGAFNVAGKFNFSPRVSATAEVGYARSARRGEVSVVEDVMPRTRVIAAGQPGNPFDEDILQTEGSSLGDGTMRAEHTSMYASLGLAWPFLRAGGARFEHNWSSAAARLTTPLLVPIEPAPGATASSLLADPASEFVLESSTTPPFRSEVQESTLQLTTPSFSLSGAGTSHLTVTLGRRREQLADIAGALPSDILASSQVTAGAGPRSSQTVYTAKGELVFPVLAPLPDLSMPLLQAGLSLRKDRYRVDTPALTQIGRDPIEFNATTGFASLGLQPFAHVGFHATFGTAFVPPPLTLLSAPVPQTFRQLPIGDPKRNGEPLENVELITGGSLDLRPERARTYKVGIDVTLPGEWGGFTLEYLRIRKQEGLLRSEDAFYADPDAFFREFGWRVVRDASGRIVRIDTTPINIAHQEVRAIDLGMSLRAPLGDLGKLELSGNATFEPDFLQQNTPDSPTVNNAGVGNLSAPRSRVTLSATFSRAHWQAGLTNRYTSSGLVSREGQVIADQGGRTVASQMYGDVFLSFTKPPSASDVGTLELRFDARNVFRAKAPFDAQEYRYFNRYGEEELPAYGLSMRWRF
ncbi:MAG: TonB-dependent receptor [Gammaproteobacteria bacterium]